MIRHSNHQSPTNRGKRKSMSEATLRVDSLVLYKNHAARITSSGDKKIEIQTDNGQSLSVRPKDVTLLHPGPIRAFSELRPPQANSQDEVLAAWELLAGETTTLPDLAELAFSKFTPAIAWALWQLVEDGLYFSGTPDAVTVHTPESVAATQATRAAKAAEEQAWQNFLRHVQAGHYAPQDERYLEDVVALALAQREQSRVLRTLGRTETPQSAHALLLQIGYWNETMNPYPRRLGITITQPDLPLGALPDEARRDLTHLIALAIDDEGSRDPDDAVSWDNGRLWVHVADVGALVPAGSPADEEARERGANLYLPEGTVHMLPAEATAILGLGLQELSPALSFGLVIDDEGKIQELEIVPSWVRVTRLSYDEADEKLATAPFADLYALAQRLLGRRTANGAIELTLPEVKLRVVDDEIVIKPLPPLRSRDLVREAMLITGEAVAQYAQEHGIAIPYSTQDADDEIYHLHGDTLSTMFAMRRLMKPSQYKSEPGRHTGLGMARYAQATSPLRRYTDLLVHQQLRAHLRGEPVLDQQTLMEHMAEASINMRAVRTAERLSNKHWTLAYLRRNPGWRGEGIVVEKSGSRSLVVLPALDLETDVYGRGDLPLDTPLTVMVSEVDLPLLETRFQVK